MKQLCGLKLIKKITSISLIFFICLIVATLLHSYDDRIGDDIKTIKKDIDENDEDIKKIDIKEEDDESKKEMENDKNDNIKSPKESKENTTKNDDQTPQKNDDKNKPIDNIQNNTNTKETKKNSSYIMDMKAEYYNRKEFDPKFENDMYYDKIPEKEILNGKIRLYSFYKVNKKQEKIIREEEYSSGLYLKSYTDYIYDENDKLILIQKYDEMANPINREERKYDSSNNLVERILYNHKLKETKKYIYEYNQNDLEIIRIKRTNDTIIERRYSYYDANNRLHRREYYAFGRMETICLYDYTYGNLYQKRVYNAKGKFLRKYLYKSGPDVESILKDTITQTY